MSLLSRGRILWVALATLAVLAIAARFIDDTAIEKDAAQNLRMAVDLAHHGSMSLAEAPAFDPTMYREPLPVAVGAAVVWLSDRVGGELDDGAYFSGPRLRFIKYENLAWLLLLWAGVLAATVHFTRSFVASILVGLLAVRPFLSAAGAEGVNNFITELPAAAGLIWASLALALAVEDPRYVRYGLAGLCFGGLALIKASFLYVFIVLVVASLFVGAARARPVGRRLGQASLLALAFALVVIPWIARNERLFHEPQIAERGGLALYTRSLMNDMSPEEYRGSFYVWARPGLRPAVGKWLGYDERDLRVGGRLQRLGGEIGNALYEHDRPAEIAGRTSEAISFYRRGRAERERLTQLYEQSGVPHPGATTDRELAQRGLSSIEHEPLRDLALIVPLLWRSSLWTFPLLLLTLIYAIRSGAEPLAFFALPSLGLVGFLASFTPLEPRPLIIIVPIAFVAAAVLVKALWRRRRSRLTEAVPPPAAR